RAAPRAPSPVLPSPNLPGGSNYENATNCSRDYDTREDCKSYSNVVVVVVGASRQHFVRCFAISDIQHAGAQLMDASTTREGDYKTALQKIFVGLRPLAEITTWRAALSPRPARVFRPRRGPRGRPSPRS